MSGEQLFRAAAADNEPEDREKRSVVEQWRYLFQKSSECFAALRHLPTYGLAQPATITRHYFLRSFQVSAKLWKFQQDYRQELQNAPEVALQRWDIGDIASKIGQLYYHYYLRTSDTACLVESYTFYDAIRVRRYFKDIMKAPQPKLWMLRKLRYYARFLVVCLLLEQRDTAEQLVTELAILVKDYIDQFQPTDADEWKLVLTEISAFLRADASFYVMDRPLSMIPASGRLSKKVLKSLLTNPPYALHEAIIVGNSYEGQVKFSELTLNMCRMLQSLEMEIPTAAPGQGAGGTMLQHPGQAGKDDAMDNEAALAALQNPHKHLLYQPTVPTLLAVIASSVQGLPSRGALYLYLSAEGVLSQKKNVRGLLMTPSSPPPATSEASSSSSASSSAASSSSSATTATSPAASPASTELDLEAVLTQTDLAPYTRRPLFLVVESSQAHSFSQLGLADADIRTYGAPSVVLMSAAEQKQTAERDGWRDRCLMTYFLHSPIRALCAATGIRKTTPQQLDTCLQLLATAQTAYLQKLQSTPGVPESVKLFLYDKFLQAFLTRFLFFHSFCYLWLGAPATPTESSFSSSSSSSSSSASAATADVTASLAKLSLDEKEVSRFLPALSPALPASLLTSYELLQPVIAVANVLKIREQFNVNAVPAAPPTPAASATPAATPASSAAPVSQAAPATTTAPTA